MKTINVEVCVEQLQIMSLYNTKLNVIRQGKKITIIGKLLFKGDIILEVDSKIAKELIKDGKVKEFKEQKAKDKANEEA
mgnify:CR=1 FL=1